MQNFQYRNLNRKALAFRLYQVGTVSDIYDRIEDGENRDRLNNPEIIFRNIGETVVFAHWGSATDEERDIPSGEFNKVTPTFVFPYDSDIKNDAHIFYDGVEYEITATTSRGNHIVADGKEVSVLSGPSDHITAEDKNGDKLELPING